MKASPRFSNEKRRKSKVDEARDILAHVVVCHVAAPKYNFTHKLAYVSHGRGRGGGKYNFMHKLAYVSVRPGPSL